MKTNSKERQDVLTNALEEAKNAKEKIKLNLERYKDNPEFLSSYLGDNPPHSILAEYDTFILNCELQLDELNQKEESEKNRFTRKHDESILYGSIAAGVFFLCLFIVATSPLENYGAIGAATGFMTMDNQQQEIPQTEQIINETDRDNFEEDILKELEDVRTERQKLLEEYVNDKKLIYDLKEGIKSNR
ncbi:hypothetical protein ACFL0W_02580 [Nanoarchaeota archaeon]